MRTSAKVSIVGAALFVVSILFGLGGTILGIIQSYNRIPESGMASPAELAGGIGNSLVSTAVGVPFALVGLGLLVGGLIAFFTGKQKSVVTEKAA